MAKARYPLTVRFSEPQMNYLEELATYKSCAISEAIRGIVEEKMTQRSAPKSLTTELVLLIKIYQLVKEIIRNYCEEGDKIIKTAEELAGEIITALGYPDK